MRKADPNLSVTWIIGKTEYALVQHTPGVEFIIFDKSRGWSAYIDLWRALRGVKFDHLLMMHASMRANLISWCVRARRRTRFDRQRARDFQWLFAREGIAPKANAHVVDGFMQFAEAAVGESLSPDFGVQIHTDDQKTAADLTRGLAGYAVISPMSSQRANNFRNWPVEHYAQIIDWLWQQHDLAVILTGGPSKRERAYSSAIADQCTHAPLDLTGETSLTVLYALLQRANIVVCPDSGPMHLAHAAGTPVVGLFATSNPERTGPYHRRELVANAYPVALQTYLGKEIADVRWGERVRDPNAMLLVTLEQVQEKLRQGLSQSA